MPTQKEVWNQIDHRFVSLKLQQPALLRERETEKRRKEIYWRNRNNKNEATVLAELLEFELQQMKKWLTTVYRVYNNVWNTQRRARTPQFVRAVFHKAIVPAIDTRKGSSCDFICNHAIRTGVTRSLVAPQLQELERQTSWLKDEWRQRTEIEATELTYENKGRTKHRAHIRRERRKEKRKPSGRVPLPAQKRASTVAKIIKEPAILKAQMYGETEYERLARKNPHFLTFRVAEKRPDLKEKVVNVQAHQRHIKLAQELAAAYHRRELSTIQTDWKKHKPKEFRYKLK